LWQQENKATIPIEVVEISSQTKPRVRKVTSKPKPVSPKRSSTDQKLRSANSPKQVVSKDNLTAKITPSTQDRSAIAFAKNQKAIAEQLQREQAEQLQRQQAEQLQREQAEQLQRQQAEQLQRQQAEQLQREQAEQLQRQQAEQLQREQAEQLQREQAEQLQREQAEQTNTQGASSQTSNAPGGSLLASLVGEPQQVDRDRHNNPARIKISDEPFPKGLEYVKFIERKPGQPVEFTVILTISEKGKLEKIDIEDEEVPEDERSYYEDFVADQVFKGWEFEPAYDNDPNDPKPSNLMVRIRIEPLP
jgi:colicin import membrane protein